jgi:predicted transcriptional regulator of viral defense system
MINSYTKEVTSIINNHQQGWVFTHLDFNKLNNLATVERVLSRLVQSKEIKRIRRGLYYIPENSRWGEVPPSQSNIIKALSRSMNTDFIPDGANALHKLGLTTQIPMKQVYLTDKQINTISIGKTSIEFRKVSLKKLSGAKNGVGIYLSAIEYLGKNEISNNSIKLKVANSINKVNINELRYAAKSRSAWVRNAVDEILERVA